MRPRQPQPEDFADRVRAMKAEGLSIRAMAKYLQCPRDQVDEVFHGRRQHRKTLHRNRYVKGPIFNSVPPEVLAERDHRLSLPPRSIGAMLFGDPEPGRSALDKKMRVNG